MVVDPETDSSVPPYTLGMSDSPAFGSFALRVTTSHMVSYFLAGLGRRPVPRLPQPVPQRDAGVLHAARRCADRGARPGLSGRARADFRCGALPVPPRVSRRATWLAAAVGADAWSRRALADWPGAGFSGRLHLHEGADRAADARLLRSPAANVRVLVPGRRLEPASEPRVDRRDGGLDLDHRDTQRDGLPGRNRPPPAR